MAQQDYRLVINYKGWGDGSVGKMLAREHGDLSSDSWRPCRTPDMAVAVCNSHTGKGETRESLEVEFTGHQQGLGSVRDLASKYKKAEGNWK